MAFEEHVEKGEMGRFPLRTENTPSHTSTLSLGLEKFEPSKTTIVL